MSKTFKHTLTPTMSTSVSTSKGGSWQTTRYGDEVYTCLTCGYSRPRLDWETKEQAIQNHEGAAIHSIPTHTTSE